MGPALQMAAVGIIAGGLATCLGVSVGVKVWFVPIVSIIFDHF